MKRIIIILLALIIVKELNAGEVIELTGWYPSPYGVYSEIEVIEGDDDNAFAKITAFGPGNTPFLLFRKARGTLKIPEDIIPGLSVGAIDFQGYGKGAFKSLASIGAQHTYRSGDTYFGDIFISTSGSDGLKEMMRLTGEGNIGIGTSIPKAERLDIVSTKNSLADGIENLAVRIRKPDNNLGEGPGLGFSTGTNDLTVGAKIGFERTGNGSKGDLLFYTKGDTKAGGSPTEMMRIKSDGEVQIIGGQLTAMVDDGFPLVPGGGREHGKLFFRPILTNENTLCIRNKKTLSVSSSRQVNLPDYVQNVINPDTITIQLTGYATEGAVFSVKEVDVNGCYFIFDVFNLPVKDTMTVYWEFKAELKDGIIRDFRVNRRE